MSQYQYQSYTHR